MSITLKPIGEFLSNKPLLELVPEELIILAKNRLPWTSYLAFQDEDLFVGVCAFKDEPGKKAEVEIAYFTFPDFEGNGHGTEMARGLLKIAENSEEAEMILAHTLRKENASARICRKIGMRCRGEVLDPEDGLVWRWSRRL